MYITVVPLHSCIGSNECIRSTESDDGLRLLCLFEIRNISVIAIFAGAKVHYGPGNCFAFVLTEVF